MPIKPDIAATSQPAEKIHLNDALPQWLLIPAFGIGIPLVTNLMGHRTYSSWELKLSYLYTIGIAFFIYQGNRYLYFTLRSYFEWHNKPVQKIITMLCSVTFYTIPVSVLLLCSWYYVFNNGNVNWDTVTSATAIAWVCTAFIVHSYETAYLVATSENEMVKNAQLQQAKAQAELQALKNQIDPHFIFNSLNTLSYLIEHDSGKASRFNNHLADVYRYILQNKDSNLVLLAEELSFLNDYFSLLKIRFEEAVTMESAAVCKFADSYLIPPISLQLLVENAIKHNEFSDDNPMYIRLTIEQDTLQVACMLKRKETVHSSSKIGLQNLNERYRLITEKSIATFATDSEYIVQLPLLKV